MLTECQICGDVMLRYRHDWLFRCDNCGVLASNFPVEISSHATQSGIDEVARSSGLDALRRRNNATLLLTLSGLAPRHASLLDVGCGPGFLLDQAVHFAGFAPEGIEPDPNVVAAARRRGQPVRHGFFPEALAEGETFDIIVFNDALEHIPDLRGAIAASARHLKPGGILCLNCPDMRGFFFRVAATLDRLGVRGPYERLWQRGLPSPHVWYFTPALLQKAAIGAGFKPEAAQRLRTIELRGLWQRIMAVKGESRLLALASFAFAVAVSPVARIVPSDATAVFFRKPR